MPFEGWSRLGDDAVLDANVTGAAGLLVRYQVGLAHARRS